MVNNPFQGPGPKAIDLAQLRAKQVAKEAKERFGQITDKLLDVILEEKVKVFELPVIVSMLTDRVNHEWDNALVADVLDLNKKDDKDKD